MPKEYSRLPIDDNLERTACVFLFPFILFMYFIGTVVMAVKMVMKNLDC